MDDSDNEVERPPPPADEDDNENIIHLEDNEEYDDVNESIHKRKIIDDDIQVSDDDEDFDNDVEHGDNDALEDNEESVDDEKHKQDSEDDDDVADDDNDDDDNDDDDDDDDEDLRLDTDDSSKKLNKSSSSNEVKSGKLKRSLKHKDKRSKKKRSSVARFFADQAEVADESDSDNDDINSPGDKGIEERVLSKDVIEAVQRVERRHKENREKLSRSAAELAKEYEERAKDYVRPTKQYVTKTGVIAVDDGDDAEYIVPGRATVLNKQSLLPCISDPGIWKVKCQPGKEVLLVRALMMKTMDHKMKTGISRIKSAFTTSSRGFVYIEAMAEPFAKESILGLYGFYPSTFARIPIEEMTSLFNVTFKKKPLVNGQWIRIKRGTLKGDLAQIHELIDGGTRAIIKAIPRPDYAGSYRVKDNKGEASNFTLKSNIRPPQKLFDPEEVRTLTGSLPERSRFGSNREMYDLFNGDYYKDGYLFKEVNVATYIQSVDINPKIDELQLFLSKRTNGGAIVSNSQYSSQNDGNSQVVKGNDSDGDDEVKHDGSNRISVGSSASLFSANASSSVSALGNGTTNVLFEIAKQLKDTAGLEDANVFSDESKKILPFVLGDLVQVTSGELRNLVGKIVSINQITKIVKILPKNSTFQNEIDVESNILVKYITPGSHVKVVSGQYNGQTGRVVAVNMIENESIAAILTDSTNTEIQCNVGYLQISEEVTSGLSSLNGYELYDLVVINENETAVVINVGNEKLRLLNHNDTVKEILPQELHGKRNSQSQRSSAFDSQQNTVKVGDTVNVTAGLHANKSGTIKHIMKGNLWLHSNTFLKNSGVFVVKGRSCVLAGNAKKISSTLVDLSSNTGNINISRPTVSTSKPPPGKIAPGHGTGRGKTGRDPDIGRTVRIIRGGFKGLLGTVVDVTASHYSLELLARMKKIVIEKNLTTPADSSTTQHSYDSISGGMNTPGILGGITPRAGYGAQTPRYVGSETPGYSGSETPSASRTPGGGNYGGGEDIWRVTASDSVATPAHTPSAGSASVQGWSGKSSGPGTGWNSNTSNNNSFGNSTSWNVGSNSTNAQPATGSWNNTSSSTVNPPSAWSSSNSTNLDMPSTSGWTGSNSTAASSDWVNNTNSSSSANPGTWNSPHSNNLWGTKQASSEWNTTDNVNHRASTGSAAAFSPSPFLDPTSEYNDWVKNIVLVFVRGEFTGKLAVLESPRNDEMVSVKLLDKSLKLDSSKGLLTTHVSELKVAEIPMGAKVIVISGKEKGLTGVVNTFQGKDILIDTVSGFNLFRVKQVAWLYQ